MKSKNHIRYATHLLVVIFLLAGFLSGTLSRPGVAPGSCSFSITKKTKSAPSSDSNIPFEEKEKEAERSAEEKSHGFHHPLGLVREVVLFVVNQQTNVYLHYTPNFCGNSIAIPLYLAKRTLLI